jgi:hypothetical protein
VTYFGCPVIAVDVLLQRALFILLILSLIYTTLKDHQQAKRSLATAVSVHTVINALEHLAIALTWSLMSQLKQLLLGYW